MRTDTTGVAPVGQRRFGVLMVNCALYGGGTDDRFFRLASALHQAGHRVGIAGPDSAPYGVMAKRQGMEVIHTERRKRSRILTVARALRSGRFEVIQAHHGRDYWPAVASIYLSGVRPALVLVRHLAKSPSWFSRLFLLGHCSVMVGVSEFVVKVLREGAYESDSPEPERRCRPPMWLWGNARSKIRMIHGAFDLERFTPSSGDALRAEWGMRPEHTVFGVVGAYGLPRGKGQREFLQAAACIQRDCPDARFAIIGRGKLRSALEEDICALGLQGKVVLTPWYEPGRMPEVMNAMDCLVLPQVGTEALPGVVIEAHACGKEVIATTIDGNEEAFRTGALGRLVPPYSIEHMADAMGAIVRGSRPSMEERIRVHERVKEEYSPDKALQRYEQLYAEILN
ncbi:MAG: glycosyltransferase family 4 protein [Limisphaerales bacterium]